MQNYDTVDCKITVNGSNLLGIIKRLKNEEITIESSNNNLVIKQNKSLLKAAYEMLLWVIENGHLKTK